MICVKSLWFPLSRQKWLKTFRRRDLRLIFVAASLFWMFFCQREGSLISLLPVTGVASVPGWREMGMSSAWAVNLFPGPCCVHASFDRATLKWSWSASSLPWMFLLLMRDVFVLEEKHTWSCPGRFACPRVQLGHLVKQRNSLETLPWSFNYQRTSAGIKRLKLSSSQQYDMAPSSYSLCVCVCTSFYSFLASSTN